MAWHERFRAATTPWLLGADPKIAADAREARTAPLPAFKRAVWRKKSCPKVGMGLRAGYRGLSIWLLCHENLIRSRAMNFSNLWVGQRDAVRVLLSGLIVSYAAFCSQAFALPGFFATKSGKATSSSTQVVLMMNDSETAVSVATDYKGSNEQFAIVLPVPDDVVLKEVLTLKRHSVERLDELTAPRFHEFWEMDPCEEGKNEQIWERSLAASESSDFLGMNMGAGDMLKGTTKAPKEMRTKVDADFRDEGSEYKFSIVTSDVVAWLKGKGYQVPSGVDVGKYSGMHFLVAETDPQKAELGGKGEALLSAIRYNTKKPVTVASTLGLANNDKMQELIIYTLHPSKRFETSNYPTVFPPTNLQVDFSVKERIGEFYAGIHDLMLAKNPTAFIAEYAWPTEGCGEPCVNAALRLDELLTLGGDAFERSLSDEVRNPQPPARSEEEEQVYKKAKKKEKKEMDDLAKEIARRKALMERHKSYVLSRLHHRYDAKGLPKDIEVRATSAAEGGIALPQGEKGDMSTEVNVGAAVNKLQTRFVNLHPDKAVIKCEKPERFRWGKPPRTYRGARKIWTAQQLASRDRTKVKPAELVLTSYPKLDLHAQATSEEKARAEIAKADEEQKAKSSGCALKPRQATSGFGLAAVVALALALVRRRRV
jgi:hypothetical protein